MMTVDSKELPSAMADLMALIEQDIPEGRQNLKDSHANLEKVADYCESNYFQAENKRGALEETKNYTTQSLASVAYQINTLAYNLLHMLDLQATQMAEMESQINHISQTVAIHKEKVARREIGILTTNKVNPRQHKILVPSNPERPVKYIRKPVDFSLLDDVGHGVKIPQHHLQHHQRGSSTLSSASGGKRGSLTSTGLLMTAGMNGSGGVGPAPTTKPPTPPSSVRGSGGMGTISRGSKEYRTPAPPIAPPQVPSNYAPNYPMGHPRAHDTISRRGSGYSTLPMNHGGMAQYGVSGTGTMRQTSHGSSSSNNDYGIMGGNLYGVSQNNSGMNQPQVGMVHPMAHPTGNGGMGTNPYMVNPSPTPPPPPLPSLNSQDNMLMSGGAMMHGGLNQPHQHNPHHSPISDGSLPEPPMHLRNTMSGENFDRHQGSSSPPLPPPPPPIEDASTTASGYSRTGTADWIPKVFLEKVVAIYDYIANRDDELSFSENSVIYVVKKNDDGWYEGVMEGITGLFPGNYVEPCL